MIVYLLANKDASETKAAVKATGGAAGLFARTFGRAGGTQRSRQAMRAFVYRRTGDNIAVQVPQNSLSDISAEQLEDTFRTNVFSYFYMTKAVCRI